MAATQVTARLFRANPDGTDFDPVLQLLDGLDFSTRRMARTQGGDLFSIPAVEEGGLGVWTLRTGVDIHENGLIRPWDLSGDLAEGSFFRFFEDGVTVMVATGHGPRTTALSSYLYDRSQHGLDVTFDPIVRVDNVAYVTNLDDVKRIEMTLTGAPSQELAAINQTLGDAVGALTAASASDKLLITFDGTDTDSRDSMWARSKEWVHTLVESLPVAGVSRLHVVVRGEISGEEDIDVLKDRIAYQIEVTSPRLDLDTAMTVAARAYDRYRGDFG